MKRSLTGIKPTGTPHLGNYFGMIAPVLELQKQDLETFTFVADLHALTSIRDAQKMKQLNFEMAAALLAFGYDTSQGPLFIQSHVPEITELMWILSTVTSMGDLSRAHAFKAAKDKGTEGSINHGVFAYPVLMAADIIIYDSDIVPVGKDQIQHIEMARAMAQRFNHHFGTTLKEPKEHIQSELATIPGTDGRKMSKSYDNGIFPLSSSKQLKKQIMNIVTDSKELEDKKETESCNIFALYKLFANNKELKEMKKNYEKGGYGYGHAKLALLAKIEEHFREALTKYDYYIKNPAEVEKILEDGAQKARKISSKVLERTKKACGLL